MMLLRCVLRLCLCLLCAPCFVPRHRSGPLLRGMGGSTLLLGLLLGLLLVLALVSVLGLLLVLLVRLLVMLLVLLTVPVMMLIRPR